MNTQSVMLILPAPHWDAVNRTQVNLGIPLSLLYISGSIREICSEITIFDGHIKGNNDVKLLQLLIDKRPIVVGINCLFSGNFLETRRLAVEIKKNSPGSKIVLGGIHPTMYFREILDNCPYIDAICLGEADQSFPLLLRHYQTQAASGDIDLPEDIHGVALREGEQVVVKERCRYIENLDALPMPGYEYFDFNNYRVDTSSMFNPRGIIISEVLMPLLSSRSCPNQCYFCAMRLVMGNRFRMRSAQNLFHEMQFLYDEYGVNYFDIADDNFSFNRKRTLEICNSIVRSGMKIYMNFWAGLMIRTLDQEVVDAMWEAGGIRFNLAVESGSDFIRNKIVRKNCSREKIIEIVNAIKKHDALANAFFMIGFPEETEESLEDTLHLINELDMIDAIVLSKVNPLPGTKLFEQCVRDDLFIEEIDKNQLWKGEHAMAKSMLDGGGLGHFIIKPYNLSIEKLNEYNDSIVKNIKIKMMEKAMTRIRGKRL